MQIGFNDTFKVFSSVDKVFEPQKMSHTKSEKKITCLFIDAHNRSIEDTKNSSVGSRFCRSPVASHINEKEKKLSLASKFFLHQASIAEDPTAFIGGEGGQTKKRRILDITVSGPIAAIADVVCGIFKTITYSLAGLKAKYQKFRGVKREKIVSGNFYSARRYAFNTLLSAIRIIPIAGVFLSYGVNILNAAACNKLGIEQAD